MDDNQRMKIRNFGYLNQGALKGQILFTGSSLMEMFPVCEIARSQGIEQVIYNRGVSGLNTDEFLENIDTLLLDLEPSKIFINIGTNDITKERFGNQWMSHLMDNICRIMEIIKFRIPDVEIFIMAFYLANLHLPWQTEQSIQWMKLRTPENLTLCNHRLKEVAEKYGRGYVHMTSRQGIEIPFIKVEELAEVKEALAKGGVGTGVCGPRVRTITACQGSEVCPSGCIDTYTLAKELDARYFGRELPHKFKFGVTGCQNNCLKAEENDVGIKGAMVVEWDEPSCIMCGVCVKACREGAITMADGKIILDTDKCNYCGRCAKACPTDAWKGETGYLVSFGGLFGNTIHRGEELLPVVTSEEQLFRITDAAIQFFADNAKPSERFQFTLERVGLDKFKEVLKEAYNG